MACPSSCFRRRWRGKRTKISEAERLPYVGDALERILEALLAERPMLEFLELL